MTTIDDTLEASEGLDLEQTRSALADVRKESAQYKSRLQEAEARLAASTSAEGLEQTLEETRAQSRGELRAVRVENLALRYDLPPELADLLQGDDPAELEAHAKRLSRFAPVPQVDTGLTVDKARETARAQRAVGDY